MDVHSLELSLWKEPCPPVSGIPDTSFVCGRASKGLFTAIIGNKMLFLPLKWRLMTWIVTILQHHALYYANHSENAHVFAHHVWFYDGLFRHLMEEASKFSSIPEDWSLPAWERFFVRLGLRIGHSPANLHISKQRLLEEYARKPALWCQGSDSYAMFWKENK